MFREKLKINGAFIFNVTKETMVRNTQGGTGTKGLARKHQETGKSQRRLRVSEDPDELYAFIEKIYGNGMCEVVANDGTKYMGHIRGKMRGKNKRNNFVEPFCVVLVGLRSWESESSGKKRNCDVITIYNDNEVQQLQQIPNVSIDTIVSQIISKKSNQTTNTNGGKDDGYVFDRGNSSGEEEDYSGMPASNGQLEEFKMNDGEQVDIDDI
uniref:S1-like domain-containing protein n=1 Tax=viral metagenome TaxID=1070528 RepID=A0A6C0I4E3_9ZZZZ